MPVFTVAAKYISLTANPFSE